MARQRNTWTPERKCVITDGENYLIRGVRNGMHTPTYSARRNSGVWVKASDKQVIEWGAGFSIEVFYKPVVG